MPIAPITFTTFTLLMTIVGGLALQFSLWLLLAVWQRRKALIAGLAPDSEIPMPLPQTLNGAWEGWRSLRVQKKSAEDQCGSQQSFELVPVDGIALPPFKPGQYLTVKVPQAAGPDSALVRCYSLSDAPHAQAYRITVKRAVAPFDAPQAPSGKASGVLHDQVQEGDVLALRAPSGNFFLDTQTDRGVVLIAGGIGITPMMCMLAWLSQNQPQRKVALYYGVRHGAELVFAKALTALKKQHPAWQLHRVFSKPQSQDQLGENYDFLGRVDLPLLKQTLAPGAHDFYVCGPPPMMATLVPALLDWGVPLEQLHFEAFGPASVQLPKAMPGPRSADKLAGQASWQVTLAKSGRTLGWKKGTPTALLDFLQDHHVQVNSGCRMGACGACETRVMRGTVAYSDLPSYEVPKGACLLCTSHPSSDLVLDL